MDTNGIDKVGIGILYLLKIKKFILFSHLRGCKIKIPPRRKRLKPP